MPITPTLTAREDGIKSALTFLRLKLAKLRRDVEIIEKAIDALQTADTIQENPLPPLRSATYIVGTQTAEQSSELEEAGNALRISEIAKRAHDQELIQSKRGYDGVYATVSTVLTKKTVSMFSCKSDGGYGV